MTTDIKNDYSGLHTSTVATRLQNLLKILLTSGCCLFLSFGIGCDDPLPVYTEPEKVVALTLYPEIIPEISYSHSDVNDVNIINVYFSPSRYRIDIEAKNIFEDVLQGDIDIQGKVTIWSDRDTSITSTINVTRSNLISVSMVNGDILTIRVGQSVWLSVFWNYRLDNGKWVFTKLPATPGHIGNTPTLDYFPQIFKCKAQIRLFKKSSYFKSAVAETTIKFFGTI
jgi:hypothetical protein